MTARRPSAPFDTTRTPGATLPQGARRRAQVATAAGVAFGLAGLALPALAASDATGAPGKAFAEGRILVQPKPGLPAARLRKVLADDGAKVQRKLDRLNVHLIEVPPGAEEALARKLARHPFLKFAEVDRLLPTGTAAPNDPQYANAWHLPKIQTTAAWDVATGSGVTVAVLDTGVDPTHLDLAANLVPGWNAISNTADTADVNNHGTWVAGTIAALTNNALGVAAIAPDARVMPVRITDRSDGYAYTSDIARGLTWAADHGARVANVSYAVTGSSTVSSAAQYLRGKGGLTVASAGNDSTDPGTLNNAYVVTVSATDGSDLKAGWSNYGKMVDFAAPGVGIWTTARGNGYGAVSGTSFSSPVTAAVAALVMAANPALLPADVEAVLQNSADDLGTAGWDTYYGFGRVNAARAVTLARQVTASDREAPTVSITTPAASATVQDVVTVDVKASDNVGVARVDLYAGSTLVGSDTTTPYGFAWDASGLPAGSSVTLTAKAYDGASNAGTSAGVSVKIGGALDTVPPTVTLTNPQDGARVSGTVTLSATGSDNAQISSVSIFVDGKLMCSATSSPACGWNTRKAKTGTHTVSATATDAAGNQASVAVAVTK